MTTQSTDRSTHEPAPGVHVDERGMTAPGRRNERHWRAAGATIAVAGYAFAALLIVLMFTTPGSTLAGRLMVAPVAILAAVGAHVAWIAATPRGAR